MRHKLAHASKLAIIECVGICIHIIYSYVLELCLNNDGVRVFLVVLQSWWTGWSCLAARLCHRGRSSAIRWRWNEGWPIKLDAPVTLRRTTSRPACDYATWTICWACDWTRRDSPLASRRSSTARFCPMLHIKWVYFTCNFKVIIIIHVIVFVRGGVNVKINYNLENLLQ